MENFYLNFLIMKTCLRAFIDWTLSIINQKSLKKTTLKEILKNFKIKILKRLKFNTALNLRFFFYDHKNNNQIETDD